MRRRRITSGSDVGPEVVRPGETAGAVLAKFDFGFAPNALCLQFL